LDWDHSSFAPDRAEFPIASADRSPGEFGWVGASNRDHEALVGQLDNRLFRPDELLGVV